MGREKPVGSKHRTRCRSGRAGGPIWPVGAIHIYWNMTLSTTKKGKGLHVKLWNLNLEDTNEATGTCTVRYNQLPPCNSTAYLSLVCRTPSPLKSHSSFLLPFRSWPPSLDFSLLTLAHRGIWLLPCQPTAPKVHVVSRMPVVCVTTLLFFILE